MVHYFEVNMRQSVDFCRDCCYDNKKLEISYPVKPVFPAKPVPVNLWIRLGR